MNAAIASIGIYDYLFPGSVPTASRSIRDFKDLSVGGACETGYGSHSKLHSAAQYTANLKHAEKHVPFLRWVVTAVPVLLDVLPKVIFDNKKLTSLSDIPRRAYTVMKEEVSNISAQQLGFLLSIIPLYNNTRTIKNFFWPGHSFDPSGHTLFKVAQYGMMYSLATDHGTKSNISMATICYLAITAIADAAMLINTTAHCHTFAEIVVGGGLGVAVLTVAYLIGKYTPLGDYAQKAAKVAHVVACELGANIAKVGKNFFPKQLAAFVG